MEKEKLPNCGYCGGAKEIISVDMELGNLEIRENHEEDCPALKKWNYKSLNHIFNN